MKLKCCNTKSPAMSSVKMVRTCEVCVCANEIHYWSGQNRLYTSFMLSINHSLQSFPKLFVLEYKEKKNSEQSNNYFEEIVLKSFL